MSLSLSRTSRDSIPLTTTSTNPRRDTSNTSYEQEHLGDQYDTVDIVGEISAALPPVDRGRKAWTFLAAAFVVEGLCWGKHFGDTT